MQPRILFVDQTGELGGGELMLLDLARHFSDRCAAVLLADGPLRERLRAVGVATTVLGGGRGLLGVSRQGGRLRTLAAAPAVARTTWRLAAMARRFDLLYPNSQKAAVVAMLAGALARRPVVWHLHDILTAEHFGSLQRRVVVGLANRLARRVIANSEASRAALVAAGGAAGQVGVVPNGLDPAPFDAVTQAQVAALRAALGIADAPLVGLFGRLAAWKGQHVLLDALPALPGVHALLVGEALFGEDDYKAALLRQAADLGVADRVHFLGFRDDVPALMRAVDVVVHTSTSPEPFGRVIVEAMLARRPVLAAASGATVEILGADSEWLVQPGDPAALAGAIGRACALSGPLREALVARHRDRAMRLFSVAGMTAGVEQQISLAF
jgi:glycosyltransferase involved in cell wall biosynthesis